MSKNMLEDWETAEATEQKGKPRVFEGLIWRNAFMMQGEEKKEAVSRRKNSQTQWPFEHAKDLQSE